jgi:hypothetical protein
MPEPWNVTEKVNRKGVNTAYPVFLVCAGKTL